MKSSRRVVISGGFDNISSQHIRFLEEASNLGKLTVLLWPDDMLCRQYGHAPKFPLAERLYFLGAISFVARIIPINVMPDPNILPEIEGLQPDLWVDMDQSQSSVRKNYCRTRGLEYRVLSLSKSHGFPEQSKTIRASSGKRVVVTGSYDWFHSGHIRFLEEASSYGELCVIVGHDANIRLLKGAGHPLLSQAERRYMVSSIKYVKHALISSGTGWLDADPEIRQLKPDIYAVNEDGDKGGKREYCDKMNIQYLVLKRVPAFGLPKRSSTELRGF